MYFKESTRLLKFQHSKRIYKDWKLLYWTSNVNNFNCVHTHVSEHMIWFPPENSHFEVCDCSHRTSWHAQWLSCRKNTSGWHPWYQEQLVLKFPSIWLRRVVCGLLLSGYKYTCFSSQTFFLVANEKCKFWRILICRLSCFEVRSSSSRHAIVQMQLAEKTTDTIKQILGKCIY